MTGRHVPERLSDMTADERALFQAVVEAATPECDCYGVGRFETAPGIYVTRRAPKCTRPAAWIAVWTEGAGTAHAEARRTVACEAHHDELERGTVLYDGYRRRVRDLAWIEL